MLNSIRSWFSIRVRNQNLKIGTPINTRFGPGVITGGSIQVQIDEHSNSYWKQFGGNVTISLTEVNKTK